MLKFDRDGLLKLQIKVGPGKRETVWTISQEVCAWFGYAFTIKGTRSWAP